jgi:FAD/FMN-containing dehydrogenase
MDMTALIADLDGIRIEQNDKIIQQKSRDFYWYSPVLKRQLDHITGDLVASPRTEEELIRVLRACYRHDVPSLPAAPEPAITARPCRCPAALCSALPT